MEGGAEYISSFVWKADAFRPGDNVYNAAKKAIRRSGQASYFKPSQLSDRSLLLDLLFMCLLMRDFGNS